jgi:HSP20 family protein
MSATLTRWDPFRELEEMHNRLSGFFSRAPARRGDGNEALIAADWSPAVDIVEDEKEYLIKAELPEVKKDEVKVTVENGALMISGERKFEKEQKGRRYHRVERAYGSFVRSFLLPDDADAGRIRAEFTNGVLHVHVAKSEAAKPKQIEVKVN